LKLVYPRFIGVELLLELVDLPVEFTDARAPVRVAELE
jgi:hypothetical protein